MVDLAHAEEVLAEALALVRQLRREIGVNYPNYGPENEVNYLNLEAQVADRCRVLGLQLDRDGCLKCAHTARALGRSESGLRWHCAEGGGPPKLRARRGHRHNLSEAVAWDRAQLALVSAGDDMDAGAAPAGQGGDAL
jgi:hypothetical protein